MSPSLSPRCGGLGVEPDAVHGGPQRLACSRRREVSLSPGAPGAETLSVASRVGNWSLAATGCEEAKPDATPAQIRRLRSGRRSGPGERVTPSWPCPSPPF